MEFISEKQLRMPCKKKTLQITIEVAKENIKKQFGKWLWSLEQLLCTNDDGIVDNEKSLTLFRSLMREGLSKRLQLYADSPPKMDFSTNFSLDKHEPFIPKDEPLSRYNALFKETHEQIKTKTAEQIEELCKGLGKAIPPLIPRYKYSFEYD